MRLASLPSLAFVTGLALAAPAWAQEPAEPEPAPPAEQPDAPDERRPRLEDPEPESPQDRRPAVRPDGRLERRRPVIASVGNPLRSISIEGDLFVGAGPVSGGEAHQGTGADYDQLWDGVAFSGVRLSVPLRVLARGHVSLWAGPLVEFAGGELNGDLFTIPGSTDVIAADDWDVSRVVFGGFFRIELGRAFMEGWFGLGAGFTGRADAWLDQSASGGPTTRFVLFDRGSAGALAGAFRAGYVWQVGQRMTFAVWFTVGGWAMGAPDEPASSPLAGQANPDGLSGGFIGIGLTVGFGLGDWPSARPEPPPARRGPR